VEKLKSKKQEAVGFEFRTHSKSIQLATRLNIYMEATVQIQLIIIQI